jgi:hypothetical protein
MGGMRLLVDRTLLTGEHRAQEARSGLLQRQRYFALAIFSTTASSYCSTVIVGQWLSPRATSGHDHIWVGRRWLDPLFRPRNSGVSQTIFIPFSMPFRTQFECFAQANNHHRTRVNSTNPATPHVDGSLRTFLSPY